MIEEAVTLPGFFRCSVDQEFTLRACLSGTASMRGNEKELDLPRKGDQKKAVNDFGIWRVEQIGIDAHPKRRISKRDNNYPPDSSG